MSHAIEAFFDASDENLAAPDGAVVTVSGAVETDADHALVPFASLGEHGRDVGAMMLHRERFCRSTQALQHAAVETYCGMTIVHDQQFVPANFVHGDQIANGFLKGAEGLVVIQVADVLADEGLAIHHQGDGVFQIGAQRQERTMRWEAWLRRREHSRAPGAG